MDAIIYIIWVSIPITLVLLSILVGIRTAFDDSKELDRKRPKRILRMANAFACYAAICASIDLYVLQDIGEWIPEFYPSDQFILLARLGMLPVLAIAGSFLLLVARAIRPRRGFDRLQMEVRGSSPLFLFIALGIVAFVVWERSEAIRASSLEYPRGTSSFNQTSRPTFGNGDQAPSQSKNSAASSDGQTQERGLFESLSENFSSFTSDLYEMVGLERPAPSYETPQPMPTPIPGDRPDFNSEGSLTFGPVVEKVALEEGVDPSLVLALVEASSGFNVRWEGVDGHKGLMGLRPDLMSAVGDRDFFNGYQNVRFGCRELKHILAANNDDIALAVARYRMGLQEIDSLSDIKEGSFLSEFVEKVLAIYKIAKARNRT